MSVLVGDLRASTRFCSSTNFRDRWTVVYDSSAAFYLMVKADDVGGINDEQFVLKMLEATGVLGTRIGFRLR